MPRNTSGLKRGGSPGRPKGIPNRVTVELKTYIHAIAGDTGKAYLDKLHDVATGKHDDIQARLKAITILLERGWGKPQEHIELTGAGGDPVAYRFIVSRASDGDGSHD
jgi:hypothetical protein